MRRPRIRGAPVPLLLVVGAVAVGCGSRALDPGPATDECDPRVVADGLCPGAPPTVCAGPCAVDADCATVVDVGPSDVGPLGAFAKVPAGACARLADGTYPNLSLVDVSLYGGGATRVRLAGLEVVAHRPLRVRGLQLEGGGLRSRGDGEVVLQGVRIVGAVVRAGGPLSLDRVTVQDSPDVAVDACEARAAVALAHVAVRKATGVGVRTCGGTLSLRGVLVEGTAPRDFVFGRAVEVSGGTLRATATLLASGTDAGLFVSDATATLGPGFYVDGHKPGLVAGKGSAVALDGFAIQGSAGAGLLVSPSGRATLRAGSIGGIVMTSVPTRTGGVASVGDAVQASGAAHLVVDGSVLLGGAARRLAVLDTQNTGAFSPKLVGVPTHPVVLQGDETPAILVDPALDVERLTRASALPILVTP